MNEPAEAVNVNGPSNDENNTVDLTKAEHSCTKLTKHLQTTIDRNDPRSPRYHWKCRDDHA